MTSPLDLLYEGRGFSGTVDVRGWVPHAEPEDVVALMAMRTGLRFVDAPPGLKKAYLELAGLDSTTHPEILIFRDQGALLELLRRDHPLLWEHAAGCTLRCEVTPDMFGNTL
ncbi:hypothetical protein [Sphingomonas sp. 3-13AW]|uniref:hypothetical protein n=1 Tax=Sphingomonas sp. 3-13AW TaxID=3050450 RepID=UPI003BB6E4A5